MAHTLSAQKRIRQSEKRRMRNKSYKSKVSTYLKKVNLAMEENKPKDEVMEAYKNWQKVLDKTTQKGIIHKNTCARRKSRMMKRIKTMFPNDNSVKTKVEAKAEDTAKEVVEPVTDNTVDNVNTNTDAE